MGKCISRLTHNSDSDRTPMIFTTDISNVLRTNYKDQYKYVVIDHIYDGDTADIFFVDNNTIIRAPFRFYGYDSAEIKPPHSTPNREAVINQANLDKDFLSSLLRNQYLVAKFMANEKYGRMMGLVWRVKDITVNESDLHKHTELLDENEINHLMVVNGHGKVYFGGSKN